MWGSRDPILEFLDPPLISRKRLKLETSNFSRRRTTVTFNENMQNGSKGVTLGPRDPILEFWDPPNISPTAEARNFKFGMETDRSEF